MTKISTFYPKTKFWYKNANFFITMIRRQEDVSGIGIDFGGQPGHMPPITEKRPCIYLFLPPIAGSRTIRRDNSSRTIRLKVYIINFIQNPASTQQYSFHQSRFHFSNFSSIPHPFRQHFSSNLIPNSYCLDQNGPNNRIYNPIYRYSYTL